MADLIQLIQLAQISKQTSLSESTIRRRIADGTMPAPVKIGRRIAWRSADINRWLESLNATTPQESQQ